MFLGDGGNDLCPIEQEIVDVAFVRVGYALEKLVGKLVEPKAKIYYWNDGNDVLSVIKEWK